MSLIYRIQDIKIPNLEIILEVELRFPDPWTKEDVTDLKLKLLILDDSTSYKFTFMLYSQEDIVRVIGFFSTISLAPAELEQEQYEKIPGIIDSIYKRERLSEEDIWHNFDEKDCIEHFCPDDEINHREFNIKSGKKIFSLLQWVIPRIQLKEVWRFIYQEGLYSALSYNS